MADAASARRRPAPHPPPRGVQRLSAAQLQEHAPLFATYEHLAGLQRGDAALTLLRKVASMVKPLMRRRGWRVHVLAEFLPPEHNLLGLNINRGSKICLRLRYHHSPQLFLPAHEILDTLLHELSHNVWAEHDGKFHRLWDELRDEAETLMRKGYTGEGFLGAGQRLGGHDGPGVLPPDEMRRLARESAEKRNAAGGRSAGSGQRLGGRPIHQHADHVRDVIADQATRRNAIDKCCASGRSDAGKLSEQSSQSTFKTTSEEDDANNRAIAQALCELMELEETHKLNEAGRGGTGSGGLDWSPEHGLYHAGMSMLSRRQQSHVSEEDQLQWAMEESTRLATPDVPAPRHTPSSPTRAKTAPPAPHATTPSSSTDDTSGTRRAHPNTTRRAPTPSTPKPPPSPRPNTIDLDALEAELAPSTPGSQWPCAICTCINPFQFLACDACGVERPPSIARQADHTHPSPTAPRPRKPVSAPPRLPVKLPTPQARMGWNCLRCGTFMEHEWWTCSACGQLKASS